MDQRILELAVAELKRQKANIEAEIEMIRTELNGAETGAAKEVKPTAPRIGRRTPAQRQAHAQRMREYWAAKRAQVMKPATAPKMSPTASNKARAKTDAQKKALSLKMKAVWKKRRAKAAAEKK
jgi:hypothetical protein